MAYEPIDFTNKSVQASGTPDLDDAALTFIQQGIVDADAAAEQALQALALLTDRVTSLEGEALEGPPGDPGRGFNPRGLWSAVGAYAVDDIVQYDIPLFGLSTYRVITNHAATAEATPNITPALYELWAAGGEDGEDVSRNLIMQGGGTISWGMVADKFDTTDRFFMSPVRAAIAAAQYLGVGTGGVGFPSSGVTDHNGAERANADGITILAHESLWVTYARPAGGGTLRVLPFDHTLLNTYASNPNAYCIAVRYTDSNLYLRNGVILNHGEQLFDGGAPYSNFVKWGSFSGHQAGTTNRHTAAAIDYAGGLDISSTNVEAAIDEVASELSGAIGGVSTALTSHLNDTTDAHLASSIGYAGGGFLGASSVEAALDTLGNRYTFMQETWFFKGPLAVVVGTLQVPIVLPAGVASATLVGVRGHLRVAGSTQTLVDLHIDGGSVWNTNQANRLTFNATEQEAFSNAFDLSTFTNGQEFTLDIDAAGTAAEDLVVVVQWRF